MRDFWRQVIEHLDACLVIFTGGDFLSQYRCVCGHGRRWHTQGEDRERGACEACGCVRYLSEHPCGRCGHGLDFHRIEAGLDGMPRWTVCISCPCQKYQPPPPPPVGAA